MSTRTGSARRRTVALATAALGATIVVVAGCIPPSGPTPTTSTTTTVVDAGDGVAVAQTVPGFQRAWDLQFAPDGVGLVTERGGTLAAVIDGQRQLVGTVPDVQASGEGGLMGLAVDPGYATNRWIYMCQTANIGGQRDVRVVRHRVLDGYSGLADATPIVTGITAGSGTRHQGCRVAFGADGDLWITTGDAAIGSTPADRSNRAGKVLRVRADGTPSPTNPYVSQPSAGWDPVVHSRGHRNVQGLAIRGADGAVFTAEHGPNCDDEINRISSGADYGWNPVGSGGGYNESVPMTAPGATPAVWSSGCPTIAPSGATFVTGARWGERRGELAVAVLKGSRLLFMEVDGNQVGDIDVRLTDRGRLRSVTNGPDGSLWVVPDAASGPLLRLVPD